ncbi:hypothetical protein Y032_0338g2949 [Ancylostoma ceylanicum]|uniref:Uncharacterized protein n=1 Tax=Ancylostoma ceylanicum TaxID=53326 RepID=A0A016RY70_9BILA|nr:hypothetical protein Y032_0338g2949 [Ancylostoma ceylanicum]
MDEPPVSFPCPGSTRRDRSAGTGVIAAITKHMVFLMMSHLIQCQVPRKLCKCQENTIACKHDSGSSASGAVAPRASRDVEVKNALRSMLTLHVLICSRIKGSNQSFVQKQKK